MMAEATITERNAADAEDDRAFEAAWQKSGTRECAGLDEERMKRICRLWFGRGLNQGLRWGSETIDRVLGGRV